ncbi:o-succinylbenzoate--CoA ligase [Ornithinibacillus massiliensis]|uniref:2-succinylbenzoate--CoA ligase n=1 Tax=Ornithinibacillus massiliensis TaxID=1944633 RepID=A0ABS5MIM4_9BACI|nr:o-succinylbenzoate--CoA ligase [Ornithinibacillus massiliensis]MBS3682189.1 o-succinylbenzoate--CoA ligase [Ornithinibacillus massiliensis]
MAEIMPHWLTKQATLSPNRPAIEMVDGSVITFYELMQQSKELAKKIANYGIEKGSHVGILSNNNPTMIRLVHALSYLGAVAVLLNTRLTKEELNYQVNDAMIKTVISQDDLLEKANQLNVNQLIGFTALERENPLNITLVTEINLDDPFTIIYTSGTTGFPKGVIHTYGNHWWSAIGSALNLGLSEKDKWLAVLPFFHVGGLSIFFKSVIYGMPVYLVEKFHEQVVLDAIYHHGVTIASVVTVMVQRIMDVQGDRPFPSHFRCMLLGGGPAPVPLLEKATNRNIPVFQSFGMTETSSQIVTLSPKDAFRKIGSAGKALFPAQIRIDTGIPMEIGEIYVKGPMVTKGYYNNSEANEKSFQDGWLSTGDLGYLDEEGFLYVVDRRKDLIISGGENIYPSEIESVLSAYDGIREVGVTGKPDDYWGQVPIAFVVSDKHEVSEEAILGYAKKHLAKYKLPKEIHFVERLPRNASNKLVRNQLLDLL